MNYIIASDDACGVGTRPNMYDFMTWLVNSLDHVDAAMQDDLTPTLCLRQQVGYSLSNVVSHTKMALVECARYTTHQMLASCSYLAKL